MGEVVSQFGSWEELLSVRATQPYKIVKGTCKSGNGTYKKVIGTYKTVSGMYKTVNGPCKTVNGTFTSLMGAVVSQFGLWEELFSVPSTLNPQPALTSSTLNPIP